MFWFFDCCKNVPFLSVVFSSFKINMIRQSHTQVMMHKRPLPQNTYGKTKTIAKKRKYQTAPPADEVTPSSSLSFDYSIFFDGITEGEDECHERSAKRTRMSEECDELNLNLNCISFPKSLKQYVTILQTFSDKMSEIIMVHRNELMRYTNFRNKCLEIKEHVDEQLGFLQDERQFFDNHNYCMLMYLVSGRVVGCLIAEQITFGHPIEYTCESSQNVESVHIKIDEREKAVLGVSRIFVDEGNRKKNVATRLLDSARQNIVSNYSVRKSYCAFTQPTSAGHEFIRRYMNGAQYLVYPFIKV
jgi:hypothetical protein